MMIGSVCQAGVAALVPCPARVGVARGMTRRRRLCAVSRRLASKRRNDVSASAQSTPSEFVLRLSNVRLLLCGIVGKVIIATDAFHTRDRRLQRAHARLPDVGAEEFAFVRCGGKPRRTDAPRGDRLPRRAADHEIDLRHIGGRITEPRWAGTRAQSARRNRRATPAMMTAVRGSVAASKPGGHSGQRDSTPSTTVIGRRVQASRRREGWMDRRPVADWLRQTVAPCRVMEFIEFAGALRARHFDGVLRNASPRFCCQDRGELLSIVCRIYRSIRRDVEQHHVIRSFSIHSSSRSPGQSPD